MITTCSGCQARYRLDDAKVPPRQVRVRCPECQNVFVLDGAPAARVEPKPESAPMEGLVQGFGMTETPEPQAPPAPPAAPRPTSAPAAAAEPAAAGASVAVAEPPRSGRRRRRDKEEMLARALVSDILVYNRETRDKALAAGNLLEALGPEIKKSWELYKEKVGADKANGTSHFRDALNEILAEGQKIF